MFEDRYAAGKMLAMQLQKYYKSSYVIAIPRGGVVVGYEVARKLKVPLDVVVARKMGSFQNPELGIGAVSEASVVVLDPKLISLLGVSADEIDKIEQNEKQEIKRRVQMYRQGKSLNGIRGQVVILVDDGLATGVTVRAAILSLRKFHPKKILLAVPVCAAQTASLLRESGVSVICSKESSELRAIGLYYRDFHQVEDAEVMRLLKDSKNLYSDRQLALRF